MTDSIYPDWPTTIGKIGRATMPDGTSRRFTVLDEIRHAASNMRGSKVFYLQQMEWETGRIECRFCNYIIGKRLLMKGNWVFGQYAPMIPAEDLTAIVKEAEARGWI